MITGSKENDNVDGKRLETRKTTLKKNSIEPKVTLERTFKS